MATSQTQTKKNNKYKHTRKHTSKHKHKHKKQHTYTYTNIGHLGMHVKIVHLKEKPHKCRFCQRVFGTTSQQKEHERTHTGKIEKSRTVRV